MIDACVHPAFARSDEINAWLPSEYRRQPISPPYASLYPPTIDLYVAGSSPDDHGSDVPGSGDDALAMAMGRYLNDAIAGSSPGSDLGLVQAHVLEEAGADYAILLPLTYGLVGDPRFESAIDGATNQWLAETWLDNPKAGGRFKGSIRVCPRSPRDAVREINRWAKHPHFVQVAVPTESYALYGEQMYFEVWRAAAEHGFPIVLHGDHGTGALPSPTPAGYPMYALEAYAQEPLASVVQLASFIAHGVFDRLPSLTVVFADGGFDYMQTLMWRLDGGWRSSRAEVPWMSQAPSAYLRDHVRFVVQATDGLDDPREFARFVELNELESVLMYGSNYPYWDALSAEDVAAPLEETFRPALMHENARDLYSLESQTSAERASEVG